MSVTGNPLEAWTFTDNGFVAQPREQRSAQRAAVPATGKVPDHLEPGQMRVIPPPPGQRGLLLLPPPA